MGGSSHARRVRAYLELLRISNILTSLADVWMGAVVVAGTLAPGLPAVLISVTSCALYLSGMVLNDYFDAAADADERPQRPIPSGRISRGAAGRLGFGLMLAGVVAAGGAAWTVGQATPAVVGVLLAACILAYDRMPKRSPLKLLLMGGCRGLNVLLGAAVGFAMAVGVGQSLLSDAGVLLLAAGMLVYIVGVTLFARSEATQSRRGPLAVGMAVAMAGLVTLAASPWAGDTTLVLRVEKPAWLLLWAVVAMLIARRMTAALVQPTPGHVQSAVGSAIQNIIVIDAACAWGFAGPFWGLAILALLPLTMLAARWIPQT